MVLTDLGKGLTDALGGLFARRRAGLTDEAVERALKDVCAALLAADVNVRAVGAMRTRVRAKLAALGDRATPRSVRDLIVEELAATLDPGVPVWEPRSGALNVLMLVGLQGAGKTTTAAKVAHHYARTRGLRTALLCADTFRAGARAQLQTHATRIGVPFFGGSAAGGEDPVAVVRAGLDVLRRDGSFELVVVDTSGRHAQDDALFAEMAAISDAAQPDAVFLVLDGAAGQAVETHAAAFARTVPVGAVVLTKMDAGSRRGGGAVAAVAAAHAPIAFIGTGEHVADLQRFDASAFVGRLLGMGDVRGLLERMQAAGGADAVDKQTELAQRLMSGGFRLADLQTQMETIMAMGPLSSVLGMLPAPMSSMFGALKGRDGDIAAQLRRMAVILDSMTAAELDSDATPFQGAPGRVLRVARGSGTSATDVEALLAQYRQFASIFRKMGRMDPAAISARVANGRRPVPAPPGGASLQSLLGQLGGADPSLEDLARQVDASRRPRRK